jgi:hypothetical protein
MLGQTCVTRKRSCIIIAVLLCVAFDCVLAGLTPPFSLQFRPGTGLWECFASGKYPGPLFDSKRTTGDDDHFVLEPAVVEGNCVLLYQPEALCRPDLRKQC